MCGIVAAASQDNVVNILADGLKHLEYRGYDSAGIATLSKNEINEVKSEGRDDNLENNLLVQKMEGTIGIGPVSYTHLTLPTKRIV